MSIKSKKIKSKKLKGAQLLGAAIMLCLLAVFPAFGASIEDRILKAWTRQGDYSDGSGQFITIKVTYYSAEYVEALVRSEAEQNLWTKDEEERYRYTLLKTLNLEECIAFHVNFNVVGTPVYLQPFDRHLKLFAGKQTLEPMDYDKRFNFRLQGQRDGMLWFPRYDKKTGKSLLDGVKDIRLIISGSISQATMRVGDVRFIWDITKDDPSVLKTGVAASRLELDRLIKRLEKLNDDKSKLQKQVDTLDSELSEIDKRIDELQRQ